MKKHVSIPDDLQAFFENIRPIDEIKTEPLTEANDPELDPSFVAEAQKAQFIHDILQAMEETGVSKSELARRVGLSRQQITRMLNEESLGNFTIDTMTKIVCALGKTLRIVTMNPGAYVTVSSAEARIEYLSPKAKAAAQ
jgi:DNA-binding phage protein